VVGDDARLHQLKPIKANPRTLKGLERCTCMHFSPEDLGDPLLTAL
jgi:hypothetical protein